MESTWPVSNKKFDAHTVDPEAHDARFNAIEADYEAQIETEKTRADRVAAEVEARSLNRYNDACGKITTEQTRAEFVETELSERITAEVGVLTSVDDTQQQSIDAIRSATDSHITEYNTLKDIVNQLQQQLESVIQSHSNKIGFPDFSEAVVSVPPFIVPENGWVWGFMATNGHISITRNEITYKVAVQGEANQSTSGLIPVLKDDVVTAGLHHNGALTFYPCIK